MTTTTTTALRWPCFCEQCSYCRPDGRTERDVHRNLDLVDQRGDPSARCVGCRRRARLEFAATIGPLHQEGRAIYQ